MAGSFEPVDLCQLVVFFVDDWTQQTSIFEELSPRWILHLEVVLNELSLRSCKLILFLTLNNCDQAYIFLGNLDSVGLWFV